MPQISSLNGLQQELLQRGILASVRGIDAGPFIYAEHQGRAIELSRNVDQWWGEFWEADPDEYAPPVKESWFQSDADALREVVAWLGFCPLI